MIILQQKPDGTNCTNLRWKYESNTSDHELQELLFWNCSTNESRLTTFTVYFKMCKFKQSHWIAVKHIKVTYCYILKKTFKNCLWTTFIQFYLKIVSTVFLSSFTNFLWHHHDLSHQSEESGHWSDHWSLPCMSKALKWFILTTIILVMQY